MVRFTSLLKTACQVLSMFNMLGASCTQQSDRRAHHRRTAKGRWWCAKAVLLVMLTVCFRLTEPEAEAAPHHTLQRAAPLAARARVASVRQNMNGALMYPDAVFVVVF